MNILYAPSSRELNDDLHRNIACGFDVLVLETLESLGQKVFYLPHIKTDKIIKDSIVEVFKDLIAYPKTAPKNIDICVSDVSNIALKYALWTKNPSILCFFGFSSISFPSEDRYFSLIQASTYCVYSFNELKNIILKYPKIKKEKDIQSIISRDIL